MNPRVEQLDQIFHGAIWDGDLISKTERDILVKAGLVVRVSGWNIVTKKGAQYAIDIGLARITLANIPYQTPSGARRQEATNDTD